MADPVPLVETTPRSSVVAAQTPLDFVNTVITDPLVQAVLNKYFGTSAHGPFAAIVGAGITAVAARFGLSLTSDQTLWLAGATGLVAGYVWNWFSKKYLTPKTPVTQGVTP